MLKRDSTPLRRALLPMMVALGAAGCIPDAPPGAANLGNAQQAGPLRAASTQPTSPLGPGGADAGGAVATGARIYSGNCVPCHGPDGRGLPGAFPSLSGSPVVQGDPSALARWVLKGQRAASMPAGRYAAAEMPSFGWMKAGDAAALFTYVRSSFGNSAPPVETSAVEAALGN